MSEKDKKEHAKNSLYPVCITLPLPLPLAANASCLPFLRATEQHIRGGRFRACVCVWVCLSAHSRRTPTSALNATCALSKRQKGASSFVSIIYELQTRHCTEHCEKKTNKPGFIAQDMPERNDVTCCWVRKQFETKNYSVMKAEEKKRKTIHPPLWKYSLSWSWHDRMYVRFSERH